MPAQNVILPYGQPVGVAGEVTHKTDSWSAMNEEAATNRELRRTIRDLEHALAEARAKPGDPVV